MKDSREWRDAFMRQVASMAHVEALFDRMPDVVFSIKDREGRYVAMSQAAVSRCGLPGKHAAIGKTAFDLFPRPMADRYTRQDQWLLRTGRPVIDNLDLTVFLDGSTGWCLTNKEPLLDANGAVIGLACISKDLAEPTRANLIDAEFADTVDHMLEHCDRPLRLATLARRAGLSQTRFNLRMKRIFHLTTNQFLAKARIDRAARLLRAQPGMPIADIALRSGFSDQSALARQFRQLTGMTPRQYRELTGAPAARGAANTQAAPDG